MFVFELKYMYIYIIVVIVVQKKPLFVKQVIGFENCMLNFSTIIVFQ